MALEAYRIVFRGELVEGVSRTEAETNLKTRFNYSDAALTKLFSGKGVVLKGGLDETTANKYQRALAGLGLVCEVQAEASLTPEIPAEPAAPPEPASVAEQRQPFAEEPVAAYEPAPAKEEAAESESFSETKTEATTDEADWGVTQTEDTDATGWTTPPEETATEGEWVEVAADEEASDEEWATATAGENSEFDWNQAEQDAAETDETWTEVPEEEAEDDDIWASSQASETTETATEEDALTEAAEPDPFEERLTEEEGPDSEYTEEIFEPEPEEEEEPVVKAPKNVIKPSRLFSSLAASEISPLILDRMGGTRPWVRLIAVVLFLSSALGIFGSLFVLVQNFIVGGVGKYAGPVVAVSSAVQVVVFSLYLIPAYFLFKYSSAIGSLLKGGGVSALESALGYQKSFWKFSGVLTLIGLILAILGIAAAFLIPLLVAR